LLVSEFIVLLVDDEPDVLAISRIALRNIKVYGLPLRIFTAASKAEAVDLLQGPLASPVTGVSPVSVALIDVIMENDQAGLQLCRFIREDLKNQSTQLYIRTGQPGVAPEREVIDRYDINGYLAKVEATEDKLYSLVKGAIRQAYFTSMTLMYSNMLHALIPLSDFRVKMVRQLEAIAAAAAPSGDHPEQSYQFAFIIDGRVMAATPDLPKDKALALLESLDEQPGTPLSADGDKYVVAEGAALLKIMPSTVNANLAYVLDSPTAPPEFMALTMHAFNRAFAELWRRAT
jgi:CheY-like chemotaxis protein